MQHIFNNSPLEEILPNYWINWCRLCAKDDTHNINLCQNEDHLRDENKKLSIQQALAKYFWVQISLEDSLPKVLCTNCLSLVTSIINFNERVERVQHMFSHLAEAQVSAICFDSNSVRLKFDVIESERDHWYNKFSLNEAEKKINRRSANENGFGAEIKVENVEELKAMEYDEYIQEGAYFDKEEMVCNDTISDSFAEYEEEDPFQHNEKKEKSEDEYGLGSPCIQIEANILKLKSDRTKKKRRKKMRSFSAVECKKKKLCNKDLKIEATCKICGKNFSKYMVYREHMQQKHQHSQSEKHWPCPVCDKILLSLYNLERHIRIHVPLEVRKTVKCTECDNRYTSNAQLENHVKYKHKNEKSFICEECGLSLRTNSNLRQHMLIHTDIRPFECEVCKKKFKNNTRLKTHMDIHSPNKHVCNICGLQLNSRATLNRHFLVHTDEMQHKCDYCGKAFKRAKALKNHLLLHTGLKPYSCDFCERTFANGSNCRTHMKKMHPEELALLEASGNKTHTKNIPKLETLKAVTKAADNLTPVVTKLSGCFAFGKKPKNLNNKEIKQGQKIKKSTAAKNSIENLSIDSPSSTPLDLQYIPLVGNTTSSSCLSGVKNLENDVSISTLTTTTLIPNFDNIYQHLMKQNQTEQNQIKQTLTQISPQLTASNVATSHHNPFYQGIVTHCLKPASQTDNLLRSPESQHSSTTPLTPDEHSNMSLIQGTFYESTRTTLAAANFM